MLDETTTDAHMDVAEGTGHWTPREQPQPSSIGCRRRGAGTHRCSSEGGRDRRERLAL
jgi:hypothetical protein